MCIWLCDAVCVYVCVFLNYSEEKGDASSCLVASASNVNCTQSLLTEMAFVNSTAAANIHLESRKHSLKVEKKNQLSLNSKVLPDLYL